jgi:hypothetical protein
MQINYFAVLCFGLHWLFIRCNTKNSKSIKLPIYCFELITPARASLSIMSTATLPLSASLAVLMVVANLIVIAACVIVVWLKAKRQRRQIQSLNTAIREYFRHGGVEVEVASTRLGKEQSFIAFIESEPMKRFRLSHIIEIALREHVAKTCKLHLTKIFWRFPLKEVSSSGIAASKQPANDTDNYINEGLVHYRDLPKGDVQEVSWEKFEESAAVNSVSPSDASPPAQAS